MSAKGPLELSGEEMRALVACAMDHIVDAGVRAPGQPLLVRPGAAEVAAALREPGIPERGEPFELLLADLFGRIIPASMDTTSPGHMAYVPGGGIFHTAVAELIANATNRQTGFANAAPGLAQLEANVVSWFCRMLGLPATAGGLLTSGGSIANLTALVAARNTRLSDDFRRGVLYISEEGHHSVRKAAMIAGLPDGHVRALPSDACYRLRPEALEEAVRRDRAAGLIPFMVVANAGATGTGAVDDLSALAAAAAREGLWLHVDAAYGGFFALTERGRVALAGIEAADSVTLDPHKSLFLPFGTGSLVVRDRMVLWRTFAERGSYLQPEPTADLLDACDLGPELTRSARGLRVWLPLKMHGAAAFRETLDEKLDLARRAAEALRRLPHLEIVAEPMLSLFCFRGRPDGLHGAELDELNRRLLARINEKRRVELSGAMTREGFVLRMCVLGFRTRAAEVDAAVEDVAASLRELMHSSQRRVAAPLHTP